jgi:hypothetical protein
MLRHEFFLPNPPSLGRALTLSTQRAQCHEAKPPTNFGEITFQADDAPPPSVLQLRPYRSNTPSKRRIG